MNKLTTSILFTVVFQIVFAQTFNRPVPNGLFDYEYLELSGNYNEYVLATPMKLFSSPQDPGFTSPYPVIFDSKGYVMWYSKPQAGNVLDFKYFPDHNRYVYTYIKQGVVYAMVMDDQFNSIDTLQTAASRDVHDLQIAQNGNWILATAYFDTMDLSAYTFDGTQGSTQTIVKGYGYEEIDPQGNLISEWNSNDFIDPTETYDYWGYNANSFDYCHGNANEEDDDGNFLYSFRHLNSIHKVDRQTGQIIWRLGGELSDFTFTNDAGFSGQHDIRRLPNGDYSLFDNGNMTGITRSVTYSLDTTNWTATKTSEYIHPVGATATAMGSYTVTQSGVEVLGYGLIYRPEPNATILDANHNRLAEYYFQDSVVSYRFLHFDLTLPQQPEIVCNWNGTNWELTTANPHLDYAWSTGETSSTIQLTQTGTYQVWVDQGTGMLGSLPLIVTDINNPCTLGITEVNGDEESYEIRDLLGRKIDHPSTNQVYLKIYESGRTEKILEAE